ncbi:MAG: DUF4262 domain-containing protein [Terriglobales bacterium]
MKGRTTDRIQFLRQGELEPDEVKVIEDVETYGCHIVQVREEGGFPGWSYTIGFSDVLGCPELIVIGLKDSVAHSLLNECARRLQQGVRLQPGCRERELLSNVDCEFRDVEKRWLRQTMGYAVWFYDGDDFTALQCVYPDLDNHFPWDEDFDAKWRNRQPLLFPHALPPHVEDDFWAANDPDSSLHDWKFTDPPHTGVFTTKRVMTGEDPVTRVFHDLEDGAWQFHGPGESKREDLTYVCFHHILDKDPTIKELADLPRGWCAWRGKVTELWSRELTREDADGS